MKEIVKELNYISNTLTKINEKMGSNIESSTLMSIGDASLFLGLTKGTIYVKTHKKTIPFSKVGKKLYFSKLDLIDWIKNNSRL